MDSNKRYDREFALAVAEDIYARLKPHCQKLKVVGSLRRYRSFVKDIEFLFIPILQQKQGNLFGETGDLEDAADLALNEWERKGYIRKRLNVNNAPTWGPLNKLAVHGESGVPVDFFATTPENWWNSLVCRTGSLASNLKITMAANKRGWSFEAYGSGFKKLGSEEHYTTTSEEDVFKFVGLPYIEPQYRS